MPRTARAVSTKLFDETSQRMPQIAKRRHAVGPISGIVSVGSRPHSRFSDRVLLPRKERQAPIQHRQFSGQEGRKGLHSNEVPSVKRHVQENSAKRYSS